MLDIFFQPSNAIPTILFLVIVLYWLVVLFGAIDFDVFDFDIDVDVDTDVDIDVDADAESTNIFGLNKILAFFNLGKIPFMVFLTFLVLPLWFGTVIVNHWLGINSFLPGLLILIPMLLLSLFVAKILTTPFVKIFAALDKEESTRDILGTTGNVHVTASKEKIGLADFLVGDTTLRLPIKNKHNGVLKRGDKVMIINDKNKTEFYHVELHNEL